MYNYAIPLIPITMSDDLPLDLELPQFIELPSNDKVLEAIRKAVFKTVVSDHGEDVTAAGLSKKLSIC